MVVKAATLFKGVIYTGHRHPNILWSAEEHGLGFGGLKTGEQGFIDDCGCFLTREEAREHFIECNQVPALGRLEHYEMLFSEDLY